VDEARRAVRVQRAPAVLPMPMRVGDCEIDHTKEIRSHAFRPSVESWYRPWSDVRSPRSRRWRRYLVKCLAKRLPSGPTALHQVMPLRRSGRGRS
jgi:hypothetical protein